MEAFDETISANSLKATAGLRINIYRRRHFQYYAISSGFLDFAIWAMPFSRKVME